jgi:ribulose-phosphate 3-epimerase
LAHLADELASVVVAGADWIHIDVMDGRFVPNITVGPLVVAAARRATRLPLDVHLMIETPERYLAEFAEAGADVISVHAESSTHLNRTLSEIRRLGKRAGVVLNPHTPEDVLRYVLEDVDLVLAMTVNPGFGGQAFLSTMLRKIEAIRTMFERAGLGVDIEVDGGIAPETTTSVVDAGANVLVAGEAVFGRSDRREAIDALRQAAARAKRSG